MSTLEIYIYNQTKNLWLHHSGRSWGAFYDAAAFTPGNEQLAEEARLAATKDDDATFVVAFLH